MMLRGQTFLHPRRCLLVLTLGADAAVPHQTGAGPMENDPNGGLKAFLGAAFTESDQFVKVEEGPNPNV